MKPVLGISAFGLKDSVAKIGESCHELGFYLVDALLPMSPFGRIRTGDEAKNDRTHTGLYWPPEARIKCGEPVRRAPIPYVWRALVEAGDRTVRWRVGGGFSFPLTRILASHVASLVADGPHGRGLLQDNDAPYEPQGTQPVVAIPDNLDEFSQESLLRDISKKGELKEAMLVWRPVASALSWLDKVGGDFPSLMGDSPRRMGMNDHIHVIYLGPDALEFTTFRMRVKKHKGQHYVLPLRNRPTDLPHITGMDWAGRLIEKHFEDIEDGAFWQAFTNFSEIWEALAGKVWNREDLPRAWSRGQVWDLWDPPPDLYNQIYKVHTETCNILREILCGSCNLNYQTDRFSEAMENALQSKVRHMAELYPEGKLRGMIVCGPLVPREVPPWLSAEFETLSARGLEVEGNLKEAAAGRLWLCTDCDDPIAEGSAIYGERTVAGIPSFLDTMPQLSVLAQEQGRYSWIPLLNAQEVLGGTEHRDTIKDRFQLDRGQQKLHVYLFKGSLKDVPNESEDSPDAKALLTGGITPCRARLIREVVRKIGSMKAVQGREFFQRSTADARYGLVFAKAFFSEEDQENEKLSEPPSAEIAKTPFRRAAFDFPSAPAHDMILDIEVRMRPASGLAKIELVPKDNAFLQGRKVRLNYSTMSGAFRLPRLQRGWPPIQELVVDPNDSMLHQGRHLVEMFEDTLPTASNYTMIIDSIRDNILKKTDSILLASQELYVRAIDQNGHTCTREGNDTITRVTTKFESDFRELGIAMMAEHQDMVFSRASWLYASTSRNITAYIKDILDSNFKQRRWMWATEAASRSFTNEEEFHILFKAIASRARRKIQNIEPFPIQAARAICRVLMFRKDGEKGLDCNIANLFARRAIERLYIEQKNKNFKILYFQLILLLLYLLRYRRTDPLCFDPSSTQTIEIFEEAKSSMAVAKRFFHRTREFGKAKRIQNIIDGFDKYLNYEGTEEVLTVLGGLTGDMA